MVALSFKAVAPSLSCWNSGAPSLCKGGRLRPSQLACPSCPKPKRRGGGEGGEGGLQAGIGERTRQASGRMPSRKSQTLVLTSSKARDGQQGPIQAPPLPHPGKGPCTLALRLKANIAPEPGGGAAASGPGQAKRPCRIAYEPPFLCPPHTR